MQCDQPSWITVPVAEHEVCPLVDERDALVGRRRWFGRSYEDETELVVRLVACVIEEVQVDEFPRHQPASQAAGNDHGELLGCPAVNVDSPSTMQTEPLIVESGGVVPIAYLVGVDGGLVEDRPAEFSDVLGIHLCDLALEIIKEMCKGRRFTDRVKGPSPIGDHQNESSVSVQDAFELTQRLDWIGKVLDEMACDNDVERIIGDGTKSVEVEVEVNICVRPSGLTDEFRPGAVPAARDRTVGIGDASFGGRGERCVAGPDLENVAQQGPPDVFTRVSPRGDPLLQVVDQAMIWDSPEPVSELSELRSGPSDRRTHRPEERAAGSSEVADRDALVGVRCHTRSGVGQPSENDELVVEEDMTHLPREGKRELTLDLGVRRVAEVPECSEVHECPVTGVASEAGFLRRDQQQHAVRSDHVDVLTEERLGLVSLQMLQHM